MLPTTSWLSLTLEASCTYVKRLPSRIGTSCCGVLLSLAKAYKEAPLYSLKKVRALLPKFKYVLGITWHLSITIEIYWYIYWKTWSDLRIFSLEEEPWNLWSDRFWSFANVQDQNRRKFDSRSKSKIIGKKWSRWKMKNYKLQMHSKFVILRLNDLRSLSTPARW